MRRVDVVDARTEQGGPGEGAAAPADTRSPDAPPGNGAPVRPAADVDTPTGGESVADTPSEPAQEPGPQPPAPAQPAAARADTGEPAPPSAPGRARGAARPVTPDAACAAAVDLARVAAIEEAGNPAAVGEHLGVEAEGDRLVLHRFACLSPAYRGWVWTVITTRAPRVRKVTIDDVVLLPGEGALLAPPWVPWSQRLRPGDVGVGDLLPTAADDPRLALRRSDVAEWVDTDAFLELGLGRPRVLSAYGRDEAAARWYAGEPGPDAHVAKVAPATCLTCGFHVRLAGVLGRMFGVCANELAPDDARVTSVDHGCGAHSEALVAPSAHPEPVPFDEDPSGLEPTDIELVRPDSDDENNGEADESPADGGTLVGASAPAVPDVFGHHA